MTGSLQPAGVHLTFGIPTCGRPAAIAACLESIARHAGMDHRVIVVDSLIGTQTRNIYARYPDLHVVGLESPIGPAAARRLIWDAAQTPYLLYLDDDNLLTPGGATAMLDHLQGNPEVGIVAGAWREVGTSDSYTRTAARELGQYFHLGRLDDGPAVHRQYLMAEDHERLRMSSYQVDATQATMMLRRSSMDGVTFDGRYDFFFDLFDFFMQCRERGVRVEVLPDVVFEHRPVPYMGTTKRQTAVRERDELRFIEKWNIRPLQGRGRRSHHAGARRSVGTRILGRLHRNLSPR